VARTMLVRNDLPELGTDLITALTTFHNFPPPLMHSFFKGSKEEEKKRKEGLFERGTFFFSSDLVR
jgi:hypothetical protein